MTQPTNERPNYPPGKKPFWQTGIFMALAILIFWPVGLFLMWKYGKERKWVKIFISALMLMLTFPILIIYSLLFGLKGYVTVDSFINPATIDQSRLYNCKPISSEWGKCSSAKYDFSFEYPVKWHYTEWNNKDIKQEILFAPFKENLRNDFVVGFSISKWETEIQAKNATSRYKLPQSEETTIGGLYAIKNYRAFSTNGVANAILLDRNLTYEFMTIPNLKRESIALSKNELKNIFNHMVVSFKKEK